MRTRHGPDSLWGSWCFQSAGSVALLSTPNRPRLSRSMFFTLQNSWLLVFCKAGTTRIVKASEVRLWTGWRIWRLDRRRRLPWWCGRGCWGGAAAVAGSGSVCGSWGWSSSGGSCEEHLQAKANTWNHVCCTLTTSSSIKRPPRGAVIAKTPTRRRDRKPLCLQGLKMHQENNVTVL